MDKEYLLVSRDNVEIKTLEGNFIRRDTYKPEIDASDIEKGTYPHYMLKEIDEQPFVIRNIIQKYQDANGNLNVDDNIKKAVLGADRLYVVACGTSYHAGLVAKEYFEKWTKIPTEVHIASEFGYNMPLLTEKPLFVFISQSGETADSRAVLKSVREMGYQALTVTNVPGSTLSREADYTMLLHAGPEIAVASTKAYTAQIAALSILAYSAAKDKGLETINLQKELAVVANAIETLCDRKKEIECLAHEYLSISRNAFFIGRGFDYHVCLEASLKLKEISYMQAEGFAGGELKHGTIALIEEMTPVIALATQEHVNLSIRGNVKEVAARGANTCVISMEGLDAEGDAFILPKVNEHLSPLVSVIPTQLLAYYAALHRECDIDKPRNLAKSVTVE
jgi:glucosamine--fructose-6-phosphate aminotransferase (isomerizing)